MYNRQIEVSQLIGKTLVEIIRKSDEVAFVCSDGSAYLMHHEQDCCESVTLEDVCGDLESLIGEPLVMAEESSNQDEPPVDGADYSYTWTFYKFATIKGYVTLRWFGTSNGYYSESVIFEEIKRQEANHE